MMIVRIVNLVWLLGVNVKRVLIGVERFRVVIICVKVVVSRVSISMNVILVRIIWCSFLSVIFIYFVFMIVFRKNCVVRIVLVGGCECMNFFSDRVVVRIKGLRIEVLNSLMCLLFF